MCRLKSGIILKGRVFVPEYDSHTQMLEELGITDDYLNASKTFVRAELLPVDGDVFSSIDNWILKVDQDVIPDWYDEETYKPQVIAAVKEWAKDHIHNGVDGLKISSGQGLYIKDCKDVGIYGNATVENICGSATVKYICDSATVENIYGSATVENICDSATVKKAKGLSVIIGSKYGWNKKETLILAENATFKDCQTKTIYQSGDWKLVGVDEKERKA